MRRFTKFSLLLFSLLLMGVVGSKSANEVILFDSPMCFSGATAAAALPLTTVGNADIGGTILSLGSKYADSSTPDKAVDYTNISCSYIRQGSAASTSNQYIKITPNKPFYNGGRITIWLSSNGSGKTLGVWHTQAANASNLIGTYTPTKSNTLYEAVIDIPTSVTGAKDIFIGAQSTSFFIYKVLIETNIMGPSISYSSGDQNAMGMVSKALSPIVLTWGSSATDATLTWLDAADGNPTTAPSDIEAVKNSNEKTITISGTPTSDRTLYYSVVATDGTNNSDPLFGSIAITSYVTPAPKITLTSGQNNQAKKAGMPITDIVYTLEDEGTTGASVVGLPTGWDGVYNPTSHTYTISGVLPTEVTYPTTYNYTITASSLTDYVGSSVTTTGSITVKDPNAKTVAFIYDATTFPSDPDGVKLYTMLNQNYDVSVLVAPNVAADTAAFMSDLYNYDLVVFHEKVGSANLAAQRLGSYIGKFPFLNTKPHMYGKTNWIAGSGQNGVSGDTYVNVLPEYASHPVFAGVQADENKITMAGSTGIIRYATGIAKGTTLATNKSGTEGNASISEINNGTISDSKKYMLVSLSAADENLTTDGLTVLKNACEYLMSTDVYAYSNITLASTSSENGSVKITPESADGKYLLGSTITLEATPAEGYKFNNWTIGGLSLRADVGDVLSTDNPFQYTVDGTITEINANFSPSVVTGINNANSSKTISSVKYYNTTGIEVPETTNGILIVKTTYTDGSVDVSKTIK